MATPIGRILLMPRGDYSGIAVYNALDWVRHAGAAWVCTTDNTTGIAPAMGVPQWQLMASDGTVGGWNSLANKPFETLGDGVTKNASDELTLKVDDTLLLGTRLSVNARNTYDDTSTKPISGQGVAQGIAEAKPTMYEETISSQNYVQFNDVKVLSTSTVIPMGDVATDPTSPTDVSPQSYRTLAIKTSTTVSGVVQANGSVTVKFGENRTGKYGLMIIL